MADGWDEVALSDVAELVMGQSPPGSTYNDIGEGLPFLQGSAEFGVFHPEPVKWCSAPAKLAEPGDLLMSVRAPVGDINFAHERLVIGRGLAVVRARDNAVTRFLALAIETQMSQLKARSGGGMFESITKKALSALKLPLPPIPEQRRIVDLMGAVHRVRIGAVAASHAAERLYFALLKSEVSQALEGTALAPLHELADVTLGKMLSQAAKNGVAEEFPYFRNADVQWDELRFSDLKTMQFSRGQREKFRLRAGDVLVCEGGEVGRSAVVERDLDEIFFQKAIHRVRCRDALLPRFLMHLMRYHAATGGFAELTSQLTIAHLTREKLLGLQLPLLDISEQVRIAALLDAALDARRKSVDETRVTERVQGVITTSLVSADHQMPESYDRFLRGELGPDWGLAEAA